MTEINSDSKCFQAVLKIWDLSKHSFSDVFDHGWGGSSVIKPKKTIETNETDNINETFCDKECFIQFLKEKMTDKGMIKLSEEEMEEKKNRTEKPKSIIKQLNNMGCNSVGGAHNVKSFER